jgi:hypothetical protein
MQRAQVPVVRSDDSAVCSKKNFISTVERDLARRGNDRQRKCRATFSPEERVPRETPATYGCYDRRGLSDDKLRWMRLIKGAKLELDFNHGV